MPGTDLSVRDGELLDSPHAPGAPSCRESLDSLHPEGTGMGTRNSEDVVLVAGATGGTGSSRVRSQRAEDARAVVAGRRDDAGEARARA
jgi:hypothetical protein